MSEVAEVNDADFAEKVGSGLAVVDFWAPWCSPCLALAPQLEKVAQKYHERLRFFKLDIQDNGDTPLKYGVSAVPTILVFKNGEVISRVVGASVSKLVNAIEEALKE